MAAPSVGRRSCAGQRKAATLISQSRRIFNQAWGMDCCTTAFFLFAVVRQVEDIQYSITNVSCRPSGNV